MNFVHLHAHSSYSILDAWGRPDQIVPRVVEAGLEAHALTDHDSVSGHIKFDKEMRAVDLKPIFGLEVRVMDDLSQREWRSEEGRRFYPYHMGLLARNNVGYHNLMMLTKLAWQQGIGGRGKYMPAVLWEDIEAHQEGLIGISGCLSGKISRAILGQIEDDYRDVIESIESRFEPDSYFIEWQNLDLDATKQVAEVLGKYDRTVLTHDVHFPTKDKRDAQNVMAAIMRWKKVVGPDGQGPMNEGCYIASPREVWQMAKDIGMVRRADVQRAMENTVDVAAMCDVTLPKIEMVRYPLPESVDKETYFKELINVGWRKRGINDLPNGERKVYLERARYEFDIIRQKDFIDYFLIIADISQFCISSDILKGPARGSSAGSLIAWCLEITEVNPIKHGLIFERFIDLNRNDLPDIDMDFPDDRRSEIHDYLSQKYGHEHVAYIGTFTTFKARNALDDVCRVFELPRWVAGKIKPYIPERHHGDVRSNMTLLDSIASFEEVADLIRQFPELMRAIDLEGQFRGMGVHPAGFVVASSPIEDVAPIYGYSEKDRIVGLDLYDAAEAGLLKIDILGLRTMTQIARARDAIRERHGLDVDFYTLPLDNEETLQGFRDVDVLGIFQFGGKATKNTLRQIKITQFSELADVNTLSRPGSMLAGTTDLYVAVHQGKAEPASIHPIVDRISADTHNLVIYQEQVLQIMREFGGLNWQISSEIRKMMSKRMGLEILEQFWEMFRDGAAAQGISEEMARDVWMKTSTFGAYGFNKSHSVSYAIIAYWQMWIKIHYPTEFYYASLAIEQDADRRNMFVQEAKRRGVEFLPINPNRSGKTFTLEPGGIRYGLTQVKGIGDKTADLLIEQRPFTSWDEILKIKGVGEKTIELFKAARFRGDDLFDLEAAAGVIRERRAESDAISLTELMVLATTEPIDTTAEVTIAGHIVSRNYRQEEKISVQAKSKERAGAKSDTVIIYVRDESGESFPVVVPGWLGNRKVKEIWEAEKDDVYLIRGKLPHHGKFFLANGLVNSDWQRRQHAGQTEQLSFEIG